MTSSSDRQHTHIMRVSIHSSVLYFFTSHPDIYKFLEILKKNQVDTKIATQMATQILKKIKKNYK